MDSNSHAELEGGVEGLFLLIDDTFLVYKQLLRYCNNNDKY